MRLDGWRRSWREIGQPAADEELFRRLVSCWGEAHRRYHTLQHLYECLDLFEQVRGTARRPGEIELALWFHDAFYDPTRDDNEERSAHWARDSVLQARLPAETADRLHALVMATRHEAVPEDEDAQLLVDVDLAILGSEPARFDESDDQIRFEYAHVPEDDFRAGRRRVLGEFLARPRLYSTEYFHSRYERPARENLARALARLGG
ncbi:MAG: N-methyl-D-aspartate receptor NMDAR2C subunit [Ramlibacter sp.]|nr:N-methyl-D-aspartate receptor NMDAR2C subunit [Ramlibacter sp.]